jgi:hypothetical protein
LPHGDLAALVETPTDPEGLKNNFAQCDHAPEGFTREWCEALGDVCSAGAVEAGYATACANRVTDCANLPAEDSNDDAGVLVSDNENEFSNDNPDDLASTADAAVSDTHSSAEDNNNTAKRSTSSNGCTLATPGAPNTPMSSRTPSAMASFAMMLLALCWVRRARKSAVRS